MYRTALVAGTILGALSVILGAFGAHALRQILSPDQLQIFETGVRYQMYHAFALLACGLLSFHLPLKLLKRATQFFITGIVLFSGSLYLLVGLKASGQIGLGGVGILTPIGGLFFILGWVFMLVASLQKR
ncbi:MAG: DUF423 domain-containing protein [Bacteroidetes bacterium]|nr:DUF423 domain-containing protein [Bacteroidota bacterium]MBS1738925.1 DUF423 domain-containing protein [Bacteroidota bacterium]MBS1776562.1 DUF423 domain-containing protein [Bacteroidota bacterium]